MMTSEIGLDSIKWSHSSAVERTAAVRLVPGSIPGGSLLLAFFSVDRPIVCGIFLSRFVLFCGVSAASFAVKNVPKQILHM